MKRSGPRPSRLPRALALAVILGLTMLAHPRSPHTGGSNGEWRVHSADACGSHCSQLSQITPTNVSRLVIAWQSDAGPVSLQASPLVAGGRLLAVIAKMDFVALDLATGNKLEDFEIDGRVDLRSTQATPRRSRVLLAAGS